LGTRRHGRASDATYPEQLDIEYKVKGSQTEIPLT
jgi:hypothetical protein